MRICSSTRLCGLLLIFATLITGCTVADVFPNLEPSLGLAPTATPAQAPARVGANRGTPPTAPGNRILIVRANGNIATINPDGSKPFALTTNASRSRQHSQPTWSPDGEFIAWTEVNVSSNPVTAAVVTSRFDGSQEVRTVVPFPPFYYYWSPDSSSLAYLSNWLGDNNQPGMAMRIVDVAGGAEEVSTLAEGQPFYFSWAPDSKRLVIHVGGEFVGLLSLTGDQQLLSQTSTNFPAPQWSPDGSYLIYAVDDGQSQSLVVTEQDGRVRRKITTYQGIINFTLSPTTNQLAYVVSTGQAGMAFGPLYLVDIDTERTVEVSEEPVLAFFWSPDGEKLAFIGAGTNARGEPRLRWQIWDGASVQEYALFLPSGIFLQRYLPFFDQYAQSMTIWSPDSSAFTYAGRSETGQEGVWVQKLGDEQPARVSDGSFAAWSPR